MDVKISLRQARVCTGINILDAAKKLYVNPQYLSECEIGKSQPSEKLLARMSVLYDIPIEHLDVEQEEMLNEY